MNILISIVIVAYGLFEAISGLRAIKNKCIKVGRPQRRYVGLSAKIYGVSLVGLGVVLITASVLNFSRGVSELIGNVIVILLLYILPVGLAGGIAAEIIHRRQVK